MEQRWAGLPVADNSRCRKFCYRTTSAVIVTHNVLSRPTDVFSWKIGKVECSLSALSMYGSSHSRVL